MLSDKHVAMHVLFSIAVCFSLQIMILRSQTLLHRTLLVTVALFLAIAHCQVRSRRQQYVEQCQREKRTIRVAYEGSLRGCEPATTKLWSCVGSCYSYEVVRKDPPYKISDCDCCNTLDHTVKIRRTWHRCEGYASLQASKWFHIDIRSCSCRRCNIVY